MEKLDQTPLTLAYLMARVDEPGGRFTDRDIALKMEEIGIEPNNRKNCSDFISGRKFKK